MPTNFSKLDTLTQGLQPGELIILAARPAVGKTSFALNIARNAAVLAGRPVVVFSLEMSRQSLVQRLICSEAHVDSYMLRTGQADSMAFQKIAKAMDTLTHADLWIDDSPGLAINTLRARARRMKAQHKIELIVIDYLQLMQGGRRDSRVQEVSDISSGLKAIAKELDVPVLALSQLSRAAEQRENKRPQLSDLRDSGSIEQDADVVLFLYREGMHNREIDKGKTELIVAKNRNGPVDDLPLVFIAEQTAFREPYLAGRVTARLRNASRGAVGVSRSGQTPGSQGTTLVQWCPMRRAMRIARAVIGSPWTRVSGTVVGLGHPRAHDQPAPGGREPRRTPIRSGSRPRSGSPCSRSRRASSSGVSCSAPPNARRPGAGPGSLLSWRRLSSSYLQSLFFTQMLPAGVGGDAMRTVEMGRQVGHGHVLASLAGSRLAGHARHDLLGDRRGHPAPRAARHRRSWS